MCDHAQMYPSEVLIKAKNGDKASLMNYTTLAEMCEKCNGFAEVFPEHKYEIVKILQVRLCGCFVAVGGALLVWGGDKRRVGEALWPGQLCLPWAVSCLAGG